MDCAGSYSWHTGRHRLPGDVHGWTDWRTGELRIEFELVTAMSAAHAHGRIAHGKKASSGSEPRLVLCLTSHRMLQFHRRLCLVQLK